VTDLIEKWGKPLYDIISEYERDDEMARSYQLRIAKLGEYYFRGHHYKYWDDSAQDYRDFTESPDADDEDYYTKVVNIYRAHGEAIIAAMSVDVPTVSFTPHNAEDADDIRTAQNYTTAALLIQKQNKAVMLFIKAVYLLWTQGFLAAYNYSHESEEYGTVAEDKIENVEYEVKEHKCPNCGAVLDEGVIGRSTKSVNQYDEATGEITVNQESATRCPECGNEIEPLEETRKELVPDVVGQNILPKSRQCIKVYGLTHIKVSPDAENQAGTPYLIFESEEHVSKIRHDFKFDASAFGDGDSGEETYARQPQVLEDLKGSRATVKRVWLRPYACYRNSIEEGDELVKDFPTGVHGVFVNGECLHLEESNLDDRWTIFEHPTSSHIHPDPMGKPLIDVNDIENEIVNLTLQTMEQGIAQTFVHSDALDFEKYAETESKPGQIYPVTLPPNRTSIGELFYTTKTAIMSQEIDKFSARNQENGRFVVGSFPSLYGGVMSGGSKTYSEYAASRQMALQRLMTPYKALVSWWADIFGKAVPEYVRNLMEDETFVVKEGSVNLNKTIYADVQNGRVGEVEPESSQAFPLTWQQKRDILIELVKMQVPEINEAILTPENATMLASLIGLPELNLPGQKSRLKQYTEIQVLLTGTPMNENMSSLPVDYDVDDHIAEARVCRDFLQSQTGLDLIQTNPEARANVLAHLKEHLAAVQQQTAQPQGNTPPGTPPESSSPGAMPMR